MSARVYCAEASIWRAAAAIDSAYETMDAHGDGVQTLKNASLEVASAQFVVVESALRVTDLLFDVGGASATRKSHNFDRHWRNACTLANHNPRAHKAAALGNHYLTGSDLPTSGFF